MDELDAGPGGDDPTFGVLTGVVETVERDRLTGWVEVRPGRAPARVLLCVDDLDVAAVSATESVERHGSAGDLCGFEFALDDLWDFVTPGNRITVRAGGLVLPMVGHGSRWVPAATGRYPLAELRERLANGEAFNRTGALHLPRALDATWQQAVLELYTAVRTDVRESTGADLVLTYGTLLGAVRENGFIGHDVNFDCAVLCRRTDPAGAMRELQQLAFALIDRGYSVRATPAALVIQRPDRPDAVLRLHHVYAAPSGELHFPYGVAGRRPATVEDWVATGQRDLAGITVGVPAAPEAVLETLYGTTWPTPDPGFRWAQARLRHETDAHLPAATIEEVYWADFYARKTSTSGSTFYELVRAQDDLPSTVIDIGCGDGRDSFAFASQDPARTRVTGLDRSHVAVRQADRKAEQLGLADRLGFAACDVGDAAQLQDVLLAARDPQAPTLFYARFFLHSIPDDVQATLMSTLAGCARPGDWFAAEFRTDRDAAQRKVHGSHYRRFQNGPAFGRALAEIHGFTPVLEQEGNGLSPYRGEDPHLYRVIARRR